jgi:hypothetical protein
MPAPTIADRLKRRFILLTADADMVARLRQALSAGWEMMVVRDLDEIGGWHDILLYRFVLMDLDEAEAFDPKAIMQRLRMEYQLNIAVFCFGGNPGLRETLRLMRADRFFERDEIAGKLPLFLEKYS